MKKEGKNPANSKSISEGQNMESDRQGDRLPELPEVYFIKQGTSRRDFLKLLGYSFGSAAILASCKRPVIKAMPYPIQPPEVTPGKASFYATGFYDGHDYCGIVVKTRDGRPIKIEGNSFSPFNGEGTTARIQASVLSLYDDARLKGPSASGKQASWEEIDGQITGELKKINSEGGQIVLLTSSIISPTTTRLINEFGATFSNFTWVKYDAVSYSAILEANTLCFGKTVIPDYHFGNASLIVSVNADFLGTWLSPVHFIPGYASRRKPGNEGRGMQKHIQFESGMSLTGANADTRKKIKPSEEFTLLADLYDKLAERTGGPRLNGPAFREDLSDLADNLIKAKGKSIVVSGTNNIDIQIVVNGINSLLGNYGECIDLTNTLNIASCIDSKMDEAVNEIVSGKVGALFMYNVNPVYDYPDSGKLTDAIKNIGLTVNMNVELNETVGIAKFECPVSHFLESWDDAEVMPGQLSLSQPCINPVFDTRSFQDSLLKWTGNTINFHDYLTSSWEKQYFPFSNKPDFKSFWNESLGKGIFTYSIGKSEVPLFKNEALSGVLKSEGADTGNIEVIITESVALGNGKHANNPWLMELPDPVSKQCWENVAAISVSDAENAGMHAGDLIKLKEGLILPVLIQPGQAEGTVSVALGYGHTNAGPVCTGIGVNMFQYSTIEGGTRKYGFVTGKIEKISGSRQLALTQEHSSTEGRPIARETVLSEYEKNPGSGNEHHEEYEKTHQTLYPEVEYDGFHWGMSIDLSKCVGCNTCVIACQAENNIPVVGKDEVIRRRIMHWIKIDRYYSGTPADPKVIFQPLPCQHCDNAPCENVCPVSATTHSTEGLNQMTYNRCLGTKYCINNCPYKVRRFNWYRYTNNKEFDFNTSSDLGKMVLNPDVTVRERGVVEKCTYCVQRIQEKKLQAKLENRTIKDFEIQTACMQACPAGAIVFGNKKDKDSKVSVLLRDRGSYGLLEDLHTLPNTGYITKIRNDGEIKT